MRHLFLLALLSAGIRPAAMYAQESGGVSVFLVSYGALSIGAIQSLLSTKRPRALLPGDQIRVRLRGFPETISRLRVVALDGDSISVGADSIGWRFARDDVESLELNLEPHGRWAEGWGIGLLVGGAVGAIWGYSKWTDDPDDWFTHNQSAVFGGVIFGVLGSTAGAVFGLGAPGKWVPAEGWARRVSVTPVVGRRTGVAARFSF